jgi:hypothetical protein
VPLRLSSTDEKWYANRLARRDPITIQLTVYFKSLNYEITKTCSEEPKEELADTQHTLFDETVHEIDENYY